MKPLVLIAAASISTATIADLNPVKTYYPVDQPLNVEITGGEGELVLLAPDNTEIARADVPTGFTGEADIAAAFPDLWDLTSAHYLQHVVDDEPIGAALVLQPMIETQRPILRQTQRGPQVDRWTPIPKDQQVMAGFRVYKEQYPVLHTTKGDITLVLRPDEAPNTSWNFMELVDGAFYTRIPFHRIIGPAKTPHGKGFMVQVGDPSGTGMGGPGYSIDLEPSTIPHDLGVISMAREGSDINTAGSQFFLCLSREGTYFLDKQYTSFGHTINGVNVVLDLGDVEVDDSDRPFDMPYIESAELIDAQPRTPGEAPAWMAPADAEENGGEESSEGAVER